MPFSNAAGATPNSLASIVAYLIDAGHNHHEDYELTPLQTLGTNSVQDFIKFAKASFDANRQKMKAGRPPRNAANWFIVRTPDNTKLDPQEMIAYEQAACEVAGMGAPVVGIMNWHRNLNTGAADLNLLSANFTADGGLIRDRRSHSIKHLRWRMDQVTQELNAIRKSRGIPLIATMQEVKRERALERGEADLVEELARLPKRPTRTQDLEPTLLSLGYEITRFNPFKDSISIMPPKKKKAKKFRISGLLEQVNAFFQRIKSVQKAPEEPAKATLPSTVEKPEITPSLKVKQATPGTLGTLEAPTTREKINVKTAPSLDPDEPIVQ